MATALVGYRLNHRHDTIGNAEADIASSKRHAVEARLVELSNEEEPDDDYVPPHRRRRVGRLAAGLVLAFLAIAAVGVSCGRLSPDVFRNIALVLTPIYFICASVKG